MKEELEFIPFGKGLDNPYGQYFSGKSYLNFLFKEGVNVANVTFEPGCRNNWHIHQAKKGGGQLLLATYGRGYYQEEGQEARQLLPGDFVYVKPNTKHWHGAAKDAVFAHLAIEIPGEETANTWLEPVSEVDYEKANAVCQRIELGITAGQAEMGEFAPEFARLNDEILFKEVWSRTDRLALKQRCLVTVVSLVSQGLVDNSLTYHLNNAKKHGVSKDEIVEALTQVAFYAGWPKVWAALRMAKKVYEED